MRRRPSLFHDHCFETGWLKSGIWTAEPVERKLTREELAECYRLWAKHGDVRTGQVKA